MAHLLFDISMTILLIRFCDFSFHLAVCLESLQNYCKERKKADYAHRDSMNKMILADRLRGELFGQSLVITDEQEAQHAYVIRMYSYQQSWFQHRPWFRMEGMPLSVIHAPTMLLTRSIHLDCLKNREIIGPTSIDLGVLKKSGKTESLSFSALNLGMTCVGIIWSQSQRWQQNSWHKGKGCINQALAAS